MRLSLSWQSPSSAALAYLGVIECLVGLGCRALAYFRLKSLELKEKAHSLVILQYASLNSKAMGSICFVLLFVFVVVTSADSRRRTIFL